MTEQLRLTGSIGLLIAFPDSREKVDSKPLEGDHKKDFGTATRFLSGGSPLDRFKMSEPKQPYEDFKRKTPAETVTIASSHPGTKVATLLLNLSFSSAVVVDHLIHLAHNLKGRIDPPKEGNSPTHDCIFGGEATLHQVALNQINEFCGSSAQTADQHEGFLCIEIRSAPRVGAWLRSLF